MKFEIGQFVKIDCIEDITQRDNYRPDVDTSRVKLEEVIEPYVLPDKGGKIPCGISSCHTPHFNGFLVRTSDGAESNIGKDCGRKHFPEFTFHFNAASRRRQDRIRRQRLNDVISNANDIQLRIDRLIDQTCGAKWLHQSLKNFVGIYPDKIVRNIRERAHRNDSEVIRSRRRSDQEIDDLVAANEGSRREDWIYENQRVGTLQGLSVFNIAIRDLLIKDIQQTLEQLVRADKDSLTDTQIRRYAKWGNTLDEKFRQVERLLQDGQRYFEATNLALLRELDSSRAVRRRLDAIEWDYEKADATPASHTRVTKLRSR